MNCDMILYLTVVGNAGPWPWDHLLSCSVLFLRTVSVLQCVMCVGSRISAEGAVCMYSSSTNSSIS